MSESKTKGRWIAIITGSFSIAIGLLYLILITVLDARGPMRPPPLEALGVEAISSVDFLEVQQPS